MTATIDVAGVAEVTHFLISAMQSQHVSVYVYDASSRTSVTQ